MNILRKLTHHNLMLNRKRSIVTIVGIVLSVALLTALASLVISFRQSLIHFQQINSGNFHYSFSEMNEEELKALQNHRDMETILVSDNLGYATLSGCKNENKPYAFLVQMESDTFSSLGFRLIEGRVPENNTEIVIPKHLRTNGRLDYKVGDSITLNVGDRRLENKVIGQNTPFTGDEELVERFVQTYTVVGIIERPGNGVEAYSAPGYTFITGGAPLLTSEHLTAYVRLPIRKLPKRYQIVAGILGVDANLYEKMHKTALYEEEYDKLLTQLENCSMEANENQYLVRYECLDFSDNTMNILYVLSLIVVIIIVVTSVYCIKNSFEISVAEKVRQYGMLSSVGATRHQLRSMVNYEGFVLGIIGIPLGIGFGVGAAAILIKVCNAVLGEFLTTDFVFSTSYVAILFALVLGGLTIYLSAAGSARKAAGITPIRAMRDQEIIHNVDKKLRTPRWIYKLWGVGGSISYRNIKRNRKKYRTSITSITICTIVFIAASYFVSVGFKMVEMSFQQGDYDLQVYQRVIKNLDDPRVKDLMTFEGVTEVAVYESMEDVRIDAPETDTYKMLKDLGVLYDGNYAIVQIMEEGAYETYLKQLGVSVESLAGKVILLDSTVTRYMDPDTQKEHKVEYHKFTVSAGDEITLQVRDDFTNTVLNSKKAKIGLVATKQPLGYANAYYEGANTHVLMNRATYEALQLEELSNQSNDLIIFYNSSDPDHLQDQVENYLDELGDSRFLIDNVSAAARSTNALVLIVSIFAYGLLAVIALIGVTNIINTIHTGMELRQREFATLRSVGMTTTQFNHMTFMETVFIGAKALVIGLPIGLAISVLMWRLMFDNAYQFRYQPPVLAIVLNIVVVFGLLFLIMKSAMTKISRKNIIETIRNENL